MNLVSQQSPDQLDYLLFQVVQDEGVRTAFALAADPSDVVSLAHSIGLETDESELRSLLNGQGPHRWVSGGDEFNPVQHLRVLFAMPVAILYRIRDVAFQQV